MEIIKKLLSPSTCILWFTMCLLIANQNLIQAQSGKEISIVVNATVTSVIEITTEHGINFTGENLQLGIVSIDPIQNSNAGKMVVRGIPNADMRLNFIRTRELRNVDTNNTLTMEYLVAGNTIEEQSTSELLDQDGKDLQFNEEGEFYLWIGATVDLSLAEPGNYTGEFNVEVDYLVR